MKTTIRCGRGTRLTLCSGTTPESLLPASVHYCRAKQILPGAARRAAEPSSMLQKTARAALKPARADAISGEWNAPDVLTGDERIP